MEVKERMEKVKQYSEEFKEHFPEEVEKIKEKIQTHKIEIWWQDECRISSARFFEQDLGKKRHTA